MLALVAVTLFVAAVVVVCYSPLATEQVCTQYKLNIKILEKGRWHESWVYGLQNNMFHSVTVQSGFEALN